MSKALVPIAIAGAVGLGLILMMKKSSAQGARLPSVTRGTVLGIGPGLLEVTFTVFAKVDSGDIPVSQDLLHGKYGIYPNYTYGNCVLLTAEHVISEGYRIIQQLNLPNTEVC